MIPKYALVLAFAMLSVLAPATHAATIVTDGQSLGVTSVPAPGSQGYVFYVRPNAIAVFTGASAASPVSYATITLDATMARNIGGYNVTSLLIGGTSYNTDTLYRSPTVANVPAHLADIVLTGGTTGDPVAAFRLGLLEDNLGDTVHNNMASVTVSSGASSQTQAVLGNSNPANDFFYFDVLNGHVGDTVSLYATNASVGNAVLSGLTFDVPEPASLLLLSLGSLALFPRRRRA